MWTIHLRDKSQLDITDEEYEYISGNAARLKLVKLHSGRIINMADVTKIDRTKTPPKFKLLEQSSSLSKPDLKEKSKNIWRTLKEKDCFKGFDSYESWEAAKYLT